ncbi:secreted RxLR effector protein 78-like [Lolium perenne]|uniref:secreted RxLR effector protein 78-like n=1 Tax=Lolium perenne TaxID=4522 RepID=UPI003A99D53C
MVVFKLDFAKAFDSVSWSSLHSIMLARGFPVLWCNWLDNIFTSSRSAVLLNGVPGRWIWCVKGLGQGDPLSPYLFLIVANVLQRLVRRDHVLLHPLVDNALCHALQYTDDTILILRADVSVACRLKLILE